MNGAVSGRVSTADGAPVSGASVMVAGGSAPAPDIAGVTDAGGRFVLEGLGPGSYRLRAFGPRGEVGEALVSVAGQAVDDVEIVVGLPEEGSSRGDP